MGGMSEGKRCGFYTAVWISAFVLSVALIVVGAVNQWKWNDYHHHFDSTCTLEPRIPAYMITAGALNIVYLVLRLILQCCYQRFDEYGEKDQFTNRFRLSCKVSCFCLYDTFFFVLTVIWLIVGTAWTMHYYERVVYDYTYVEYYCPRSVYIFSFVVIVVGWALTLFTIVCGMVGRFSPEAHDTCCCISAASEKSSVTDEVERYV